MTDLLRIENLVVEYATRRGTARALDKASIILEENKTLGLAGESGCGKSTLGRAIMRLVPYPGKIIEGDIFLNLDQPVSVSTENIPMGEVNLMNLDEDQMRALRGRMIAYIFQDPMTSLNPMLTIGDHFIQIMQAHDSE
ncbi:MAG: ATP-binding cassette domain-containing protein, partial [Candidatus Thorarchaeota archaeon]